MLLSSLFRQLMMSQTIRFMLGQPLKRWLTGRKRGEDGNTKILQYLENEKSSLDKIKNIFHSF